MADLRIISGEGTKPIEKKSQKFMAVDKEFEFELEVHVASNGILFCWSQVMNNPLPYGLEKIKAPIKETSVAVFKKLPIWKIFTRGYWKPYESRKLVGKQLCDSKFESFKKKIVEMRQEELKWESI